MAFTIDEVPKEVYDLWIMKWGMKIAPFGVGASLIKKYNDERERLKVIYPEWFPMEGEEIFPKKTNL